MNVVYTSVDDKVYSVDFVRHSHSVEFHAYDEEAHGFGKDSRELFVTGHVKWDGCTNFSFNDSPCMLHTCSRESLVYIGVLLGKIFDQCADLMKDVLLDGNIGNQKIE
jgi:hypothetical protein